MKFLYCISFSIGVTMVAMMIPSVLVRDLVLFTDGNLPFTFFYLHYTFRTVIQVVIPYGRLSNGGLFILLRSSNN